MDRAPIGYAKGICNLYGSGNLLPIITMKTLTNLVLAILLCGSVNAATLTVRETSSTNTFKLDEKSKGASWAMDSYDNERTVQAIVAVTPVELEKKPVVEIYYIRLDAPRTPTLGQATATITKVQMSEALTVKFEGNPKMKDAWAARMLIEGKVVAVAAENDTALKWVTALK